MLIVNILFLQLSLDKSKLSLHADGVLFLLCEHLHFQNIIIKNWSLFETCSFGIEDLKCALADND